MNEIANNPLEKRNKEYYENLKVERHGNKIFTNERIWPPRYNEIAKEQEWQNLDSTPVEKRRKLDEMKRYWRDDTTLRLNG